MLAHHRPLRGHACRPSSFYLDPAPCSDPYSAAARSRYAPRVSFNTDGTFSAKVDCNQVSGTYTASGSELTVTPSPSTLAACPEDSLDALYLAGLGTASSYSIASDELTITLSDEGTMQFVPA